MSEDLPPAHCEACGALATICACTAAEKQAAYSAKRTAWRERHGFPGPKAPRLPSRNEEKAQ